MWLLLKILGWSAASYVVLKSVGAIGKSSSGTSASSSTLARSLAENPKRVAKSHLLRVTERTASSAQFGGGNPESGLRLISLRRKGPEDAGGGSTPSKSGTSATTGGITTSSGGSGGFGGGGTIGHGGHVLTQ